MADKLKTISREEALLRRAEVLQELQAVYAELAGAGSPEAPVPVAQVHQEVDAALARLPLSDAIVEVLRASKKTMTPLQLWRTLEAAGFEATSETPVKSVGWALKKLLKTNADVFHTGWGHWHLKSKYTKQKLAKLLASRAGRGGRSKAEHVARTLEGVARAKAEGRPSGRPSHLNAERVAELHRLLSSGGTTVAAACRAVGIAPVIYYGNRKKIEAWREGDPWPPPEERLAPAESGNVVRFGRRKKNETPSGKPEGASREPAKGKGSSPNPSLFEPEASHLGAPPAKGREAVPGGGT
jgi:hypothetical protein